MYYGFKANAFTKSISESVWASVRVLTTSHKGKEKHAMNRKHKAKQIKETAEEIFFLSLDLVIVVYIYMDAFSLWKFL